MPPTPHIARVSLLLVASIIIALGGARAQTPRPASEAGCGCRALLDNLISKVEANYVGYHLAVRGRRDAEYGRHVESLTRRAQGTPPENCIFVLRDFVGFFRDGHLFINESPKLGEAEVARLTRAAEQTGLGEGDIRRYLEANAERLDPIEGIWYAKDGYRVGIVRDQKASRRDFVAVMLSSGVERWSPGQVKAEFRRLRDGSYDVVFYSSRHYPLHLWGYARGQEGGAAIRRGVLLHMPPVTWGKAYPLRPGEQNLLDPADPRRPTIRPTGASTVVVSVPSHSPEYAPVLKSLVERFRAQILRSELLIIDIRGNEGGSSWTTDVLMPFLATAAKRPPRYWTGDHEVVLSSPDNVAYFERMQSQGWVPARLVERLQANPGSVVPFNDPAPAPSPPSPAAADVPTPRPRHVAILMDGAVVSAGEAFVIKAMRNMKVTLFGENTGGTIDYQSVHIVPVPGCPPLGINLGYPTSAASGRLPAGGVNATGIPPGVRIRRAVRDPIRFIINYYARGRRR